MSPTPAAIRTEHARRVAIARRHSPFGALTATDRTSAIKRTAQALRVSVDDVMEAMSHG